MFEVTCVSFGAAAVRLWISICTAAAFSGIRPGATHAFAAPGRPYSQRTHDRAGNGSSRECHCRNLVSLSHGFSIFQVLFGQIAAGPFVLVVEADSS